MNLLRLIRLSSSVHICFTLKKDSFFCTRVELSFELNNEQSYKRLYVHLLYNVMFIHFFAQGDDNDAIIQKKMLHGFMLRIKIFAINLICTSDASSMYVSFVDLSTQLNLL